MQFCNDFSVFGKFSIIEIAQIDIGCCRNFHNAIYWIPGAITDSQTKVRVAKFSSRKSTKFNQLVNYCSAFSAWCQSISFPNPFLSPLENYIFSTIRLRYILPIYFSLITANGHKISLTINLGQIFHDFADMTATAATTTTAFPSMEIFQVFLAFTFIYIEDG